MGRIGRGIGSEMSEEVRARGLRVGGEGGGGGGSGRIVCSSSQYLWCGGWSGWGSDADDGKSLF